MDATLLTVSSRKYEKTPEGKKVPSASQKKIKQTASLRYPQVLTPKNGVPRFYFISQKHYAYIIHNPSSSTVWVKFKFPSSFELPINWKITVTRNGVGTIVTEHKTISVKLGVWTWTLKASCPGRFTPGTSWTGGCVGPTACFDAFEKGYETWHTAFTAVPIF
jgi:hypothetical protein